MLLARLRGSAVVLVVVGERWLAGEIGHRAIDDPEDWVRREILEALERGIPVVPVLFPGATLDPDRLPVELGVLARLQRHEIHRLQQSDIKVLGERVANQIPRLAQRQAVHHNVLSEATSNLVPGVARDIGAGASRAIGAGFVAQARDFAPEVLRGRDDEQAGIAEFCAGGESYLWWQAGPWAGKTALAAWTALYPPAGVTVVSFFFTRTARGHADSDAFSRAMVSQFAAIAGEPLAPHLTSAELDRERRRLLTAAATRVSQSGGRLLLVVDGLDEDAAMAPGRVMPSIASLLPVRPPAGVQVMVTSRPHPDLPDDVAADHPLRRCTPVPLRPSEDAGDLRMPAIQEINRHLHGGNATAIDLIGYLLVSGGGLTQGELATLTGKPGFVIGGVLAGEFGRTLRTVLAGVPDNPAARAYLFAHDTLRETAETALADVLTNYRQRLHSWAEQYQTARWPAATPGYLLTPHGRLLAATGEVRRLADLTMDRNRHDRMLAHTLGEAAFAEITTAQHLLGNHAEPDVALIGMLAVRRIQLTSRTSSIDVGLPGVWASLGLTTKAEALARGFGDPVRRAQALAAVAFHLAAAHQDQAQALLDEAEQLIEEIGDLQELVPSLGATMKAASVIDPTRAERLADRVERMARAIEDGLRGDSFVTLTDICAEGQLWDRAERITLAIEEPELRSVALDHVIRALASAGEWDRAERLAQHLDDPDDHGRALFVVCEALADHGLAERGELVARAIDEPGWRAAALAMVAARHSDRNRARQLAGEAYTLAAIQGPGALLHVLMGCAAVWAAENAVGAAKLLDEAEHRAYHSADPATALRQLIKPMTLVDPDRASQLAAAARHLSIAARDHSTAEALFDLAETLIEARLWEQAELTARELRPWAQSTLLAALAAAAAVGTDPELAQRVALAAEDAARTVTHQWERPDWERVLEALVGADDWDGAEQLADRSTPWMITRGDPGVSHEG